MKSIFWCALVAANIPSTLSQTAGQTIIPSTLPACAQACPNLLDAQTACTAPPNPTPGGTYGIQCFCGYAPLLPLGTSTPQQLCSTCSPADNAVIQSWYKGACGLPGGQVPAANGQNGQSTTPTTPTSTSPTSASTATGQGTTVKGDSANAPNVAQKDWISTHWRWVLMLIILVLGFAGLAVGGVYLRRYIHRRREAREFGVAGSRRDLETWGPGHSVHDIGTTAPANTRSTNEKGKEREVVQNQEVARDRTNSRRLKKGWLPGRNAK